MFFGYLVLVVSFLIVSIAVEAMAMSCVFSVWGGFCARLLAVNASFCLGCGIGCVRWCGCWFHEGGDIKGCVGCGECYLESMRFDLFSDHSGLCSYAIWLAEIGYACAY